MQQGNVRILLLLASLMIAACATLRAAPEPPAAVVVAFDREDITPLLAEGTRNRQGRDPVTANDPVRIASVSKLVMTLATLRLVDEGAADLDKDISEYLGWTVRHPSFPEASLTLRQLLGHRSGLHDAAGYVIPLGQTLKDKLADPEIWADAEVGPGDAPFEYANLNSAVVATTLEAATGERYDKLVKRTVFAPLGIEACFNWLGCSSDQVGRAVALYRHNGEVARDHLEDLPPNCTIPTAPETECSLDGYEPGTNASVFSPQGGMRIGMVDLAKIGQALLANSEPAFLSHEMLMVLAVSARSSRNSNQKFFCSYGTGLQTIPSPAGKCLDDLVGDGRLRFGHSGEAYGLQSGLWFDPQKGEGFAYFLTRAPPPVEGEDTGGFSSAEKALIRRALEKLSEAGE